jgi:uncharacterized membrane protein YeaQ/YmgE (transglycosylase-associated protein family)
MKLGLFALWVLAGLLIGWLAGIIAKQGGYGRMEDLALGLVGSIAGGWIFWAWGASPGPELESSAVVAVMGAAAVVCAQRRFWSAGAGTMPEDGHGNDA